MSSRFPATKHFSLFRNAQQHASSRHRGNTATSAARVNKSGKALSVVTAALAVLAALPIPSATGASISTFEFSLGGTDSLTSVVDSIAGSTWSNRLMRFRPDVNSISKMTSDVSPNSNLVAFGTSVWFTTRDTPYRIGRADLTTVSGAPLYTVP